MKRVLAFVAAAWLLIAARAATAQYAGEPAQGHGDADERTAVPLFGFNIAGMASFPLGSSSNVFNPGGGFALGVMFRPKPFIGLQLEYSYSWYDIKGDVLSGTKLDGLHTMQYWDLNLMARPARARRVGFYLIAGPGIYRRMAEITKLEGVGVGTYCDPVLYFCFPTPVPISDVIASRSSTDFGVNGGLGMYFVLSPPLRLYLEGRYHFIWGPDFSTASGKKRSADGQYIPITLGLAF